MTIIPFSSGASLPKFPPLRYEVAAKGGVGEIILYGVIGDPYGGISDTQFKTDLRKLHNATEINVYINSPGGYVSAGRAIYNSLRAHTARKIVHVDGEACSIAALIAMAGDEVRMGEGTFMLVHRAWSVAAVNADTILPIREELLAVDEAQIDTYARRTKMSRADILALMREDRYMSADEAVKLGFADVSVGGLKMAALSVDRSALHLKPLPTHKLTRSEARAKMAAIASIKPARGAR